MISLLSFAYAQTTQNSFRTSYQNLHLDTEDLGLFETSYLFNFCNYYGNCIYTGASVYSAISGKRGGFFVSGLSGGYQYKFHKFIWDSGLFLGGGGGGAAPQGSGFMIRAHTGLSYRMGAFDLGVNFNHIDFPDGKIKSNQVALQLAYNFKDIYLFKKPENLSYDLKHVYFAPFVLKYFPLSSNNTHQTKQKSFNLIGTEIGQNDNSYLYFIEAGGAINGNSDGYAEYFFGMGKQMGPLQLKASLGAAGGGSVNTSGGMAYKLGLSTQFHNFKLQSGYYGTFQDTFKAYFLSLGYEKRFNLVTAGNHYSGGDIDVSHFKLKIYNERYLSSATIRKNSDAKPLDNLAIDLDYLLTKNIFVGITASSAYRGNSGGYATGMLGVGYIYNSAISPFIKLFIGAGGGGSVDVGGGLIAKAEAGVEFKNFFLGAGKIKALNGNLDDTYINVGVLYKFGRGTTH